MTKHSKRSYLSWDMLVLLSYWNYYYYYYYWGKKKQGKECQWVLLLFFSTICTTTRGLHHALGSGAIWLKNELKVGFLVPISIDCSRRKGHMLQEGPSANPGHQKTAVTVCFWGRHLEQPKKRASGARFASVMFSTCLSHGREWGEVSQCRVGWYAQLWFCTKIKCRAVEQAQTGNHLFPCAAAMTAMLMLDLP